MEALMSGLPRTSVAQQAIGETVRGPTEYFCPPDHARTRGGWLMLAHRGGGLYNLQQRSRVCKAVQYLETVAR